MKDSSAFEANLVASKNDGLTDSQASRFERVRNSEYEQGKYLILPQRNYNVNTKFGEDTFVSPRHTIVKIDGKKASYCRSWKCSNYDAQMTCTETQGIPKVEAQRNADGLLRLPTGTGAVLACRDFIPKVVEKDEDGLKRLAIKAPILINYVGVQKGFSPSYVKNSDGKYEVELNDANEIKWQSTSIPEFTVLKDEVAPELIEAAKEVISKDSQLNGLTKLI